MDVIKSELKLELLSHYLVVVYPIEVSIIVGPHPPIYVETDRRLGHMVQQSHLKLNISKTSELVVDYIALNMHIVAKMLQIHKHECLTCILNLTAQKINAI